MNDRNLVANEMKKLLGILVLGLLLSSNTQASEMLEPSLNTQLEKGYSLTKIELIKDRYKIFTLGKRETPREWIYCKVDLFGDHKTECWRP